MVIAKIFSVFYSLGKLCENSSCWYYVVYKIYIFNYSYLLYCIKRIVIAPNIIVHLEPLDIICYENLFLKLLQF